MLVVQIKLRNFIGIPEHQNAKEWKIHFAMRDADGIEPLDEFLLNPERMVSWNESPHGKSRKWHKHIFHLVRFYPEKDTWLFVGIYDVVDFDKTKCLHKVSLSHSWQEYIGRLKITYNLPDRNTNRLLSPIYDELTVKEILPLAFEGEGFNGYENIDLSFNKLTRVLKGKTDNSWKIALENVFGIYLITDRQTGKLYVGSAYGEEGIWGRWANYVSTFHGGNKGLRKLLKDKGSAYFRENMYFSVLEVISKNNSVAILDRETHWKNILDTREHGYNNN